MASVTPASATSPPACARCRSPPNRDGKFVEANYENCLSGDYPLARFLYVYVNKKPGAPIDKLTAEFLKFVASKEGQEIVVKDGYFPIPANVAAEDQATLSGKK